MNEMIKVDKKLLREIVDALEAAQLLTRVYTCSRKSSSENLFLALQNRVKEIIQNAKVEE